MAAAGFLTPDQFLSEMKQIFQYTIDLETVRANAEKASGPSSTVKPAAVDAKRIAEENFGIKVEASPIVKDAGNLTLIINTQIPNMIKRYWCDCTPSK